jgi:peptide/nickel transport system substrate-binding protein
VKSRFLALFSLVATLLAGCGDDGGASSGESSDEPVQGGTAIVSRISDFDAFNQFVSTDSDAGQVLRYMLFMPLVRLDSTMNYEPYLAESTALAEDGMSLTFQLRPGVNWHDGTPVTADDVVWSAEMYMDPELAYANVQYFQFVDRVEKIDDRTVAFHFNAPHSDPLADFLEWEPMPKHLLQDVSATEMANAPFNRNPVGNGPFRFVSWTTNQQVVFEANQEFALGRPNLDRVVFRIIPEQTTEMTELLTGNIHLIRNMPPEQAERAESDLTRLVTYPSRAYSFIAWNTKNPLFEDARVRRALTLGIDRQQILDALLYGYGTPALTDVLPFQWQFKSDIQPWPYDPNQAKQLLQQAGWSDTNGDGIIDKDGRPFRFSLETNQGNDLREDIIVIVQSDLRKIGIDAQPRLSEWNSLIDRLTTSKDFDAVVNGWVVDFKFDPSETLGCSNGPYNYPSYCNARADSLVQQGLTTLDNQQAMPLWHEYQQIIHEEQPYTFLYYQDERLGISRQLRGVIGDARGHLVSVKDWWLAG